MHAQHNSFRLQHGGCRDPTDTTVPAPPRNTRNTIRRDELDPSARSITEQCAPSRKAARLGDVCAEDLSPIVYKTCGLGSLMICHARPHASNHNTRGVGGLQNAGCDVPPAAKSTVRKSRRIQVRSRFPPVYSSYTATRPLHSFAPTLFLPRFYSSSPQRGWK